jgi:hypothetical protein
MYGTTRSPARLLVLLLSLTLRANAEEHPCDGVQCSNKGYCIEDKQYNRGYWCSCDPGWVGQDCTYPQPTVECGDKSIKVSIDKGIVKELQIEDNPKYVYFGQMDPTNVNQVIDHSTDLAEFPNNAADCRANESEDGEYQLIIRQPFTACGTQVVRQTIGDDYTFSNTVVWNSEVNNTQGNINRELILLDFKCIYQDSYTVVPLGFNMENEDLVPTVNSIKFVTAHGSFAVEMSIFQDSSFSPSKEYQTAPSIPIGSFVYVQVSLDSVKDEELAVTMDNCFATTQRDPSDKSSAKHFLISNRCVDEQQDPTVHIYQNGESHKSRFKFQMFKWRWSADDVYLHCEIDICNKTNEVCQSQTTSLGQCNGEGKKRRKRDLTTEGTYPDMEFGDNILTKGPLRVTIEENLINMSTAEEEISGMDATMIYLGVSLGFVLAVLGVVVGSIIRKRRTQTEKLAKLESERRLTGQKFTREAF